MSKIITYIFHSWKYFLFKIKQFDNQTVYFEGGLGSQILSFITYNERLKSTNKFIPADLEYFKNIASDFTEKNGLAKWKWRLNKYGVNITDLPEDNKFKKRIKKYFFVRNSDNVDIFYNFRETKSSEYISKLPIDLENVSNYLEKTFASTSNNFCIIHIRRGDYLKVASSIMSVEEIIDLILKIKNLMPKNILISSDSLLEKLEIELLDKTLTEFNYVFINPNESDLLIHDLMRFSKVLIASNSTFSFTAGLLSNKDCLFFFPTKYFGEGKTQDSKAWLFRQPFGYLMN
jgi:hypothetical protein